MADYKHSWWSSEGKIERLEAKTERLNERATAYTDRLGAKSDYIKAKTDAAKNYESVKAEYDAAKKALEKHTTWGKFKGRTALIGIGIPAAIAGVAALSYFSKSNREARKFDPNDVPLPEPMVAPMAEMAPPAPASREVLGPQTAMVMAQNPGRNISPEAVKSPSEPQFSLGA